MNGKPWQEILANQYSNEEYADVATRALYAYQQGTNTDDCDVLASLLCALQCWADAVDQDFGKALAQGTHSYNELINESLPGA